MQPADRLRELMDLGIIEQVVRPLKSGKEASVFVVIADGEYCAAKVYKEAQHRSFRNRQDYVEGRSVRNSRQQRAMNSGSKFGQKQNEEAWQNAEAAAMARLHAAGVRIPRPRNNAEGVLLMDLVVDQNGDPAPQIATRQYSRNDALYAHDMVIHAVTGMLCAGLVHGDLSEFNILAAHDGPMIIDLPQAVDATRNNNAKRLLLRDVANVKRFFGRFAPELFRSEYGEEMWLLYESSLLRPNIQLTGRFQTARKHVDAQGLLKVIAEAKADAAKQAEIKQARDEARRDKVQGIKR
ncbi:MAG: PA4780 family RIO1-like protein kinase [Planctomycetota bacterium]